MAEPAPDSGAWITISGAVGGILGAMLGFLGPVIAALVSRHPSLAVSIDARIRTILENDAKRIRELEAEVIFLKQKLAEAERAGSE